MKLCSDITHVPNICFPFPIFRFTLKAPTVSKIKASCCASSFTCKEFKYISALLARSRRFVILYSFKLKGKATGTYQEPAREGNQAAHIDVIIHHLLTMLLNINYCLWKATFWKITNNFPFGLKFFFVLNHIERGNHNSYLTFVIYIYQTFVKKEGKTVFKE